MVTVEIILIIIGVIFLIGSHYVQEKLSQKDVEKIALMTEVELKTIVEKQVKEARTEVENLVEEVIDESLEITQRGLERETNNKIMAISDYSDTVMESMNKTHNEIMFLYSMLNDKHTEMTELAGTLQKYSKPMQETVAELTSNNEEEQATQLEKVVNTSQTATEETLKEESATEAADDVESPLVNKNEQILALHKEGKNEVEIAKALDCGLGEVRLVLGLYNIEQE